MSSAWNCAIWNFQNILNKKCGGPGAIPGERADVCGFIEHPNSQLAWCVHNSSRKCWASVEETRAAIMKSGCIWTLLVTSTLTDHEGSVIIAHCSKKNPASVHLTEKNASMATPCIHKMMISIFYAFFWLCLRAFHGHGHVTCWEAFQPLTSVVPLFDYFIHVTARVCYMSIQFRPPSPKSILLSILGFRDPHLMGNPQRRGPCVAMNCRWSYLQDLRAALVSTFLGSISSALLASLERLPTRTHLPAALREIRAAREYESVSLFALIGAG